MGIGVMMGNNVVASGALLYAKNTGRYLFLQKAYGKHQGTWGLVGGTNMSGERPWQGLQREITEEIGMLPDILKTIPLETFMSEDTVFNFHTFVCVIEDEFIPSLSDEHCAWAWATLKFAPKPLHQGLRNSLANKSVSSKIQTIFDIVNFI